MSPSQNSYVCKSFNQIVMKVSLIILFTLKTPKNQLIVFNGHIVKTRFTIHAFVTRKSIRKIINKI